VVKEGENEITSIFFSSASMFAFFVFSHERIADIFLAALSQLYPLIQVRNLYITYLHIIPTYTGYQEST
jgi:hypothetical protein